MKEASEIFDFSAELKGSGRKLYILNATARECKKLVLTRLCYSRPLRDWEPWAGTVIVETENTLPIE